MLNTSFEFWDYFIFGTYALMIIAVGLWVSRGKKGVQKTTVDYFLASKSLPWWAIGASLIAERHFDGQELQQQRHGNRDQNPSYSPLVRSLLPE